VSDERVALLGLERRGVPLAERLPAAGYGDDFMALLLQRQGTTEGVATWRRSS